MMRQLHKVTCIGLLALFMAACSGGGGGAPAPEGGGGGGDVGGGNGGTVPLGGTKLPDGSIQLADGTIKYPDGSTKDKNGIIIMADGTVKFPEGTTKLPDGTMKLPNGAIAKPDGTIITQAPKKPEVGVPGGDDKITVDPPFNEIIPTAVISGVEDGGLYSSQSELTATAGETKVAASFEWVLSGPGLETPLTSSGAVFKFKLPAPSGNKSVGYTLTLKAIGKEASSAKEIVINSAALPVPVLNCDLQGMKVYPVNQDLDCTSYSSENTTKSIWKVEQKVGNVVSDVAFTFYKPEEYKDKSIDFTPTKIGTYTVTLTVEGPGGKVSQSVSFEAKDLPIAKITGVEKGKVYSSQTGISASGSQSTPQGEIKDYWWTLFDVDGVTPLEDSVNGVDYKKQLAKGSYFLQLETKTKDGLSGFETVEFEVVDPPSAEVEIRDINNYVVSNFKVGDKALATGTPSQWTNPSTFVWTITFAPSDGGAPVVSSKEGFSFYYTLDKAGKYEFKLTITDAGGTSTAQKIAAAQPNQAVGNITGISAERSYRQQEMSVSGAGSANANQYAWSLKKGAVEEANFNTANIQFTPADFGAYSLQLIVGNEGGDADPVSAAFNVRTAQGMQMMPFAMQSQAAVLALGERDIYVGGAGGLYHLGADKQWVRVIEAPIYSVWARSSNEVFAGAADAVFRYTAASGWQEFKQPLVQNGFISLTGYDTSRLYGISNGTTLLMSPDNGVTWQTVKDVVATHVQAVSEIQKVAVATKDGKLKIVDGLSVDSTIDPGVAGLAWAKVLVDGTNIVMAATNGEIYFYDGAAIVLFGHLPIETINNVAIQQYAKAMWMSGGELHVISQNGAEYTIMNGQLNSVVAAGGLDVAAASGGNTIVAVDTTDVPFRMLGGQWTSLVPTGDSVLEVTGVATGWPRIEARGVGKSVFLMNAKSVKGAKTYYLQEIKENGSRRVLPVEVPVLDLWGSAANNVYILTANRIYLYDGSAVTDTGIPTTVPTTIEKISAIGGDSHTLKFVATNLGVYRLDGGNFTQLWVSNAGDMNFRSLWVSPSDQVFAGAASGDIMAIKPDGSSKSYALGDPVHQILGVSEGRLYATTDTKVLSFDEANDTWVDIPVQGGAAITPHNIGLVNSSELFVSAGASGLLHYVGGVLSVVSGLPAGDVAYAAHAGQFDYYGILDPKTGVVALYQFGPMQ